MGESASRKRWMSKSLKNKDNRFNIKRILMKTEKISQIKYKMKKLMMIKITRKYAMKKILHMQWKYLMNIKQCWFQLIPPSLSVGSKAKNAI